MVIAVSIVSITLLSLFCVPSRLYDTLTFPEDHRW